MSADSTSRGGAPGDPTGRRQVGSTFFGPAANRGVQHHQHDGEPVVRHPRGINATNVACASALSKSGFRQRIRPHTSGLRCRRSGCGDRSPSHSCCNPRLRLWCQRWLRSRQTPGTTAVRMPVLRHRGPRRRDRSRPFRARMDDALGRRIPYSSHSTMSRGSGSIAMAHRLSGRASTNDAAKSGEWPTLS